MGTLSINKFKTYDEIHYSDEFTWEYDSFRMAWKTSDVIPSIEFNYLYVLSNKYLRSFKNKYEHIVPIGTYEIDGNDLYISFNPMGLNLFNEDVNKFDPNTSKLELIFQKEITGSIDSDISSGSKSVIIRSFCKTNEHASYVVIGKDQYLSPRIVTTKNRIVSYIIPVTSEDTTLSIQYNGPIEFSIIQSDEYGSGGSSSGSGGDSGLDGTFIGIEG